MQAFTDFILQVTYPPNPIRTLDNSLTTDQAGRAQLLLRTRARRTRVADLQRLPHARPGAAASSAPTAVDASRTRPQLLKVAAPAQRCTRRSACSAWPAVPFFNAGDNGHQGRPDPRLRLPARRQRRHALPLPSGQRCSTRARSTPAASAATPSADRSKRSCSRSTATWRPIVGQQITLTNTNAATVASRIDLLLARADAGECDVIVKGHRRRRATRRLSHRRRPFPDRSHRRSTAVRQHAPRPGRHRRAGTHLHLRPTGQRRAQSASTATRTARTTATRLTPAPTRPTRTVCPSRAPTAGC